jgi:DNA-binding beta-propeller fold protein YncE
MTAEMTAEGLPIPPGAVEGKPAEEEKPRRRRKAILLLLLLGLLAMLTTIVIWYLIFRQPINPLPLIPVSQLPSYTTSVFGATSPTGVAASPSGDRIYVTQTEGDRVALVFDAAGNPVGTMVPPESTGAEHVPVYVAIDPLTDEVYLTDRATGAIYIYDRDGKFQRTLTLAEPRPGWQPLGITFDKAGNLYVTDLSGTFQKVLVIDRTARVIRTLGESSKLSFPNGVAVDAAGNVYVTDSNNGRLLVFGSDGTVAAQVGRGAGQGNLGLPRGVAVDPQNRVLIADSSAHGVFVFRALAEGERRLEYLGFFGGEGSGDGLFEFPMSVAPDARGRVYVADTANNRVQVWSY